MIYVYCFSVYNFNGFLRDARILIASYHPTEIYSLVASAELQIGTGLLPRGPNFLVL